MGMSGISKSQVSRLCGEIDDKVQSFLTRPLEGDWVYVWLDATYQCRWPMAYMDFPVAHRTKLHSINPIERLNHETGGEYATNRQTGAPMRTGHNRHAPVWLSIRARELSEPQPAWKP
jgi:transposase-like protein